MSTSADLSGLGMPGALAARLGNTPASVVGAGTALAGGAAITTKLTALTTASSQTAAVLPSAASLGAPYWVNNISATTGLIYPPDANSTINGGSAGASFSLAQNKTAVFIRYSSTIWFALLTA